MLKKPRSFRPYYVNECEDIKFAIKQVASQFGKDMDLFDFELQSITTYKKNLYEYELEQIPPKSVDDFLNNRDNMLEPNLVILQRYCILIKEREQRNSGLFHLNVDKFLSEAYLVFRTGFVYRRDDFENICEQIRKEKAWNKILCFNEEAEFEVLKGFLETFKYPLKSDVRYLYLKSANLVPSFEAKLEFKRDLSGQFETIVEDELICEFYKPAQGKPGRNLKGDYIIPQPPKSEHQTSNLHFDENSIKIVDYPYKIEYKSAIGGILKYDNNFLSIEESLETKQVSLKTTGSLIGDIDSGTVVNITENDALKEALGQGMRVQAGSVNIDGNVGANAQINSKEVRIAGFTHQDSKIFAKDVEIATHKGYLKGESVKVAMLETGIIEGKKVEVERMYGGKIYAEEIIIQTLHANAFLYATKSIHIKNMEKGENKFFLASNYSPKNRELYNALLHQKNHSIKEAIHLTKELKIETLELKKLKTIAEEIRHILLQYKNTKTTPPKYLLERFEAYHKRVVALREKRQKINALSALFKEARDALSLLDRETKDATIIVESGWVGYNEVHYIFNSPSRELLKIPKPGEPSKVIYKNDEIHLVL